MSVPVHLCLVQSLMQVQCTLFSHKRLSIVLCGAFLCTANTWFVRATCKSTMKSSVTCLSRTAPTCPSAKIREGEGSDQPYTIYSFCVGTHVSCAIACVGCGLGQTQYDLDVGTGRVCLPASAFLSKLAWEATCHYHLMIPPLRKHAPATAPQLHWNYFMLCMRHTGCFRQIGVANAGLCCRGVFVEGLSEWVVRSPGEVYQLMARGQSLVSASQSACMPVSCVCACSPRCGLAILLV